MAKISALVHTLNEESNIEDCLTCLKWCDEIVVVDMMSEDRTVDIARRFTDRIYSFPRMGLADPARKFGVEKTTGDWVLIVDADELIPRSLAKNLREISEVENIDIVLLPRKNYLLGEWIKYTAWWPEYHARFFKKGKVIPNDRVHENYTLLSDRVFKPDDTEVWSFEHFNYFDSRHFIHKLNAYTDKEAEAFDNYDKRMFSFCRLFMLPIAEFTKRFIYKKGFLDGMRGFFLSAYMAFYRFLAEAKLWERKKNPNPGEKYKKIKTAICEEYREPLHSADGKE